MTRRRDHETSDVEPGTAQAPADGRAPAPRAVGRRGLLGAAGAGILAGGMLGGLGGFFLPPLFAYTKAWSGFPTSTFFVIFVLTAICAVWMHVTVVRMLGQDAPELAGIIERPMEKEADA